MAKGKMVYVSAPKKNDISQSDRAQWAEKKKNEVLAFYLANGSVSETSRQCRVPLRTVQMWKSSDWWRDRVAAIQAEEYDRLDSKLTKALEKALDKVIDRVEYGEEVYDSKTGGVVRVQAKLRDLNSAFNTLMDKRQLIRKQPTKIVEQQSTATQLQNLASQFAAFVSGKPIKETIDQVSIMDADNVQEDEDGVFRVVDNSNEDDDDALFDEEGTLQEVWEDESENTSEMAQQK